MNEIIKRPLDSIGYNFVTPAFLPPEKDEYYLRNQQNSSGIVYRNLSAYEIEALVRNNNTSDDWTKILVSDYFNPQLVMNCKFFGLVRIGKLESIALEYHNISMPVGLYNSIIISCDFGDNVVINNVNHISHYIIGSEVIIANVHELHTTNHSKFGNGIIKEGEDEGIRVWIEIRNENAGRKILPFNGMLPGDAYLWSKHREDETLLDRFREFTEQSFDNKRGYYGKVGDRTIIKNTSIIKDVWVGSDAYIKGANKLKNLTINSSPDAQTQIGEGCELVNGIIDYGCRIFYGVKAVRFVMASHSQLKYGARLINSYLGNNATISCCEVLNSLIYPAHEQHHNNSFLCAALLMGQSNLAAGATLGSNHNSRAADGELIAGRGFWPGLCVSIKHNSKFATFNLLTKGDYSYELNIPLPFSLISNDVTNNKLVVMPAYWFMYNMYALARNATKYVDRDKRIIKQQRLEYDFLAPDSVNEIFTALNLLRKFTAMAYDKQYTAITDEAILQEAGEAILNNEQINIDKLTILAYGFENNSRPTQLIKVKQAYSIYKQLLVYYGVNELINQLKKQDSPSSDSLLELMHREHSRSEWCNIGGQLIPEYEVQKLIEAIHTGQVKSWDEVHQFYQQNSDEYENQKWQHALASLIEITELDKETLNEQTITPLLQQALNTRQWMVENIHKSRAKDYQNEFRKMVYSNEDEMENVVGRLEDNSFILQQKEEFKKFEQSIKHLLSLFSLPTETLKA